MISEEIRLHESIGSLSARSAQRVSGAVLGVLATAARRQGDKAQRLTALTLLGSVALLAIGVTVAAQSSLPVAVALCLLGAVGMLVSGYAGTRLDGAAHARPTTVEFIVSRRRRDN